MEKQTKEQAIEEIAEILGISEENVNFDKNEQVYIICDKKSNQSSVIFFEKDINFDRLQEYSLKFSNCSFNIKLKINKVSSKILHFEYVKFCEHVDFSGGEFSCYIKFFMCEFACFSNFNDSIFHNTFKSIGTKFKITNFENSVFEQNVYFGKNLLEKDDTEKHEFGFTKFGVSSFKGVYFKKNAYFKNCIFQAESYFSNINAEGNVYFDGAKFKAKEVVKFYNFECQQTISFYNTDITQINFSQISFFRNIGITNAKIIHNFKSLKKQISKDFEEYKLTYNLDKVDFIPDIKTIKLDEFINNFRDSFRILKNALIKENNLLEASNFHKYELYCKEMELEEKKPKVFSKEWVDKWQLFFYRKLCDHHTDLLLNLKWLIITIGMFASMLFMIKLYNHGLCILNAFNFYGLYLSALGSFILSALALFRCIDKMKAFVSINAMAILWVICYKPKLIFGIANLIGDNSYNAFENLLITLYTLIVGLIIFSLQKTARKNSIIPT
ncbi:hypothetical protein [Campylobacter insulaenigrae]|uniref:hypothetical protein n=1 Tax=Campylobacter insulaenigrae TaxID=260714 RepID=UPI002152210D|nr:hypothetical protein [Campylobacter insulaenigrae]MCR6572517.1 hypothetical protein [Campylobacter insulaenigrae]MCR6581393.1 hypothetical protein [Campylobacter insulaenigrae]